MGAGVEDGGDLPESSEFAMWNPGKRQDTSSLIPRLAIMLTTNRNHAHLWPLVFVDFNLTWEQVEQESISLGAD